MRRKHRPINEQTDATGGYTFHFQIKDKVGRRACSINVQAPSVGVAETLVRQNWSMIEAKARDGLIDKSGEDRTINLAMPCDHST
jgi:hypothetical protein